MSVLVVVRTMHILDTHLLLGRYEDVPYEKAERGRATTTCFSGLHQPRKRYLIYHDGVFPASANRLQ